MTSQPINDGFFLRWAIILLFKILRIQWFSRLFKWNGPVVFLSPRVCVKATSFTSLAEASAMRFVAENTAIPVPEVYSAFQHRGIGYIVMERIDGRCLAHGWRQRTADSLARILNSLRSMIQQLRQIPAPTDYGVFNVDGGAIYDQRLPGPKHWGPFTSIDDFHRKLRAGVDEPVHARALVPDFARLISFHRQPWPCPVFTHGDLSSLNILARGDDVVGIVDWETAGWMPSYWEYTSAWNVNPRNQFWQDEIDQFLDPFPEALAMEAIRRKYNGDY